jgi:hypothetical protein
VAPHVIPHPTRGQNRHFRAHSVLPPVERTGVAASLSSPGTAYTEHAQAAYPAQSLLFHPVLNLSSTPILQIF